MSDDIDVFRGTSGVQLPEELSSEIWAKTREASAIMQVARQIPLPGPGITVNVMTGDPVADFVDETDKKPVSTPTFSAKSITPHTIAVTVPISNQFKRDLPRLYREVVRSLPPALGKRFDQEVFKASTGLSNFDVLGDATSKVVDGTDTYGDLVAVLTELASKGADLTNWIASPALHALLLTANDSLGRPFFVSDPAGQSTVGSVFGAPVTRTRDTMSVTNNTGFAGDFASSAVYGTVEGVKIAISEQSSLTVGTKELTVDIEGGDPSTGTVEIPDVINLFERNMFAVRAEIEVGFRVRDKNDFVMVKSA